MQVLFTIYHHYLPEGKEERSIYAPPFLEPRVSRKDSSLLVGLLPCHFYLDGAGAGTWTLTSILVVRLPNNRALKTKANAKSRITKITRTATTPALPPPSPLSPINDSSCLCWGIRETNQRGMRDCYHMRQIASIE